MVWFSDPILRLLKLPPWNFITCCSLRRNVHRKKQLFSKVHMTIYLVTWALFDDVGVKISLPCYFFIPISHSKTWWKRKEPLVCLLSIIRSWASVVSTVFSWYCTLFTIMTHFIIIFFTKHTAKPLLYIKEWFIWWNEFFILLRLKAIYNGDLKLN